MAAASSAINDHRILSPISEHPVRYPSPAAPGRTRRSLPRLRRRFPTRKIGLPCGVVEAVGATAFAASIQLSPKRVLDNGPDERL
jgi:hypothetical protein